MKSLLAALATVVGLATAVQAEPLSSKQVAADAKWLVHVDMDAVQTGKIPQTIGALWLSLPSESEKLRVFGRAVGMDLPEDLHGITVYGWHYTEADGVVIVHVDVDRERLMQFLRTRPGYRTDSYGDRELVRWTENRGKKDEHTVTGCFFEPTVIVFGRDAQQVKQALDVLGGTLEGLAEGDPLFAGKAPAGTMLEARALGFGDANLPLKSPVVRRSKSLYVSLGEHEGEAFAVARLVTESAEVANQVRAIVGGLLAMGELHFESNQEITAVLQAVKVSTNDKAVTVECRGAAEDAAKLIKQVLAKQLKLKRPN